VIEYSDQGQLLSHEIEINEHTTHSNILKQCRTPKIPLHLLDAIDSCLHELKEMKEQDETDNLIDYLLLNPVSKLIEENLEFPRVFSLLFFSDFKNQQRLIKIEQQMNVLYRDLLVKPNAELNVLKTRQRKEYQKFVRDLSMNSDLTQKGETLVNNTMYPKLPKCKTFEISFKIPGEIQNDVSRSTMEMFGMKQEDYKVNLFFCVGSTCSNHLASFDEENDLNEISQRTRNIHQLYSNDLNALITPCMVNKDFDIHWIQDDYQDLGKYLSSPELHFESYEEQLDLIKKEYMDTDTFPLPSEFFLTKHSNLSWIHSIFHTIVGSKEERPNLKEVFVKCASFGVSNVSIQLPFDSNKTEKVDILNEVMDVLSAVNLSYGKCKVKSFKNIFLFLPNIKLEQITNMERQLYGCLGVENVITTNLSKFFE
jgi:hypothetical protein